MEPNFSPRKEKYKEGIENEKRKQMKIETTTKKKADSNIFISQSNLTLKRF